MNILDAFKIYGSLDAEQKSFLTRKQLTGDHTASQWLALLGNVAAYDRQADAMRKSAGWGLAIFGVLTIIGGIIYPWLALLFALLCIGSLVLFTTLRGRDVPNNLRLFILPLLAVLREDMERDAPLHLELELKGNLLKEKLLRSEELVTSGYPRILENFYQDRWMLGRGELADGSSLEWTITDDIRERKITKLSQRGKIKVKTKYKMRRMLEVRVGLRNDEYALAASAASSGKGKTDRIAIKEGEKRNVLKLRRILVYNDPKSMLKLTDFMDLLAGAYRRVQLTNAEER